MSFGRVTKRLAITAFDSGLTAAVRGVEASVSGAVGSSILDSAGLEQNVSEVAHVVGVGGLISGAIEGMAFSLKESSPDWCANKHIKNTFSGAASCFGSLFPARQLVNALVGYAFLKMMEDLSGSLAGDMASATLGGAVFGVPFAMGSILFCAALENRPGYAPSMRPGV